LVCWPSPAKLTNYDFSTITIKDYPIDVACEVFSRINTRGKVLTVFEIMVAKTYDEAQGFDLAERYEVLRDGTDDEKETRWDTGTRRRRPAAQADAAADRRSRRIRRVAPGRRGDGARREEREPAARSK
jgi:hypothetical protein